MGYIPGTDGVDADALAGIGLCVLQFMFSSPFWICQNDLTIFVKPITAASVIPNPVIARGGRLTMLGRSIMRDPEWPRGPSDSKHGRDVDDHAASFSQTSRP